MGLFNLIIINKNKDLRKPECPYCKTELKKIPGRKSKCVNCGNFMFVRTTPKANNRVLVTEEKAKEIDIEWAKINGTYDDIVKKEKEIQKIREKMKKDYGKEPLEKDIMWSYLNSQLLNHIKNNNWGLYVNTKREMAQILEKEDKLLSSLDVYLNICFLETNGANNSSSNDLESLKEFPPFNLDYYSSPNPWLINKIKKIAEKENLKIEDIKNIFIDRNKVISKYGTPLSPDKCWKELERELVKSN